MVANRRAREFQDGGREVDGDGEGFQARTRRGDGRVPYDERIPYRLLVGQPSLASQPVFVIKEAVVAREDDDRVVQFTRGF